MAPTSTLNAVSTTYTRTRPPVTCTAASQNSAVEATAAHGKVKGPSSQGEPEPYVSAQEGDLGKDHQQSISGQCGEDGRDVGTVDEEVGHARHGGRCDLNGHRRS